MGKSSDVKLPHSESEHVLANDFGTFFCEKIEKIRDDFSNTNSDVNYSAYDGPTLGVFSNLVWKR